MSESLRPTSLAERLAAQRAEDEAVWESYRKEKRERDKSEFESVIRESASCGSKLRAFVRAEAERTRSAIAENLKTLRSVFARILVGSLTIGVLLVFGVALGLWGLISFLGQDIQQKLETRQELAAQIEQQNETLKQLQAGTWGIDLRQMENGRFVVLPEGTIEDTIWAVDGRPAVRLSSE